jgi:alpha-tubulin suppressor-like RCC1 family protein
VKELALGQAHACALLEDGKVKCWGGNFAGQLGRGVPVDQLPRVGTKKEDMGDELLAVDLGKDARAIGLVAGANHASALLEDRRVKCCGENQLGQLGLCDLETRGDVPGEMGDALVAVALSTERELLALASSAYHTCALFTGLGVKCWGSNGGGQLGIGDNKSRGGACPSDAPNGPGGMGDGLPFVDLGLP